MNENKKSKSCAMYVGCDVQNCKYHNSTENRCTAEHISVQNKSAINKAETYCGTFCSKGSSC